jgi:hypothetical protein
MLQPDFETTAEQAFGDAVPPSYRRGLFLDSPEMNA